MTTQDLPDYVNELQKHLGTRIQYQGRDCQLIEIIYRHPPILVFSGQANNKPQIQSNQHGNANRRIAETYNISLLNDTATDLHPVAKECLPETIHPLLLDALLKA